MPKAEREISKFLSLVLRHRPDRIGIELDGQGWVAVDDLLVALPRGGIHLDRDELQGIVARNDKQRFALSEDGQRIRANQGHSVEVDLGYEARVPPDTLFHGTATRHLAAIRLGGIHKGRRHHVHLSIDREAAVKVGARHGVPVVLEIDTAEMHADGYVFHLSTNGVWLTDHVPPQYLR